MTVLDAINDATDEYLYIGSASAYVWIGRKNEAVRAMKSASEKENADLKRILKRLEKKADIHEEAGILAAQHRERLNNWVDFLDRKVIDIRPRRFYGPLGTIIQFEGEERGKYWTYDEIKLGGGPQYVYIPKRQAPAAEGEKASDTGD